MRWCDKRYYIERLPGEGVLRSLSSELRLPGSCLRGANESTAKWDSSSIFPEHAMLVLYVQYSTAMYCTVRGAP